MWNKMKEQVLLFRQVFLRKWLKLKLGEKKQSFINLLDIKETWLKKIFMLMKLKKKKKKKKKKYNLSIKI